MLCHILFVKNRSLSTAGDGDSRSKTGIEVA